jgi:hypothetical protein
MEPGGSNIAPGGSNMAPDGSTTEPNGLTTEPDGLTTEPDGLITKPDNLAMEPAGADTDAARRSLETPAGIGRAPMETWRPPAESGAPVALTASRSVEHDVGNRRQRIDQPRQRSALCHRGSAIGQGQVAVLPRRPRAATRDRPNSPSGPPAPTRTRRPPAVLTEGRFSDGRRVIPMRLRARRRLRERTSGAACIAPILNGYVTLLALMASADGAPRAATLPWVQSVARSMHYPPIGRLTARWRADPPS